MHKEVVDVGTQFALSIDLFGYLKRALNKRDPVLTLYLENLIGQHAFTACVLLASKAATSHSKSTSASLGSNFVLLCIYKKGFAIFLPLHYLS